MDTSPDLLGENYQITDGLSMDGLLDLSDLAGEGKQSQRLPIRPPLWQRETMPPIFGGRRSGCYLERYLLRTLPGITSDRVDGNTIRVAAALWAVPGFETPLHRRPRCR